MWLFTPQGFISVVADRNDPTSQRLLVRARSLSHLQYVLGGVQGAGPPFQVEYSDYPWRSWVSKKSLIARVSELVEEINYDNFKNQISEEAYHDACLDVWLSMCKYERLAR